VSAKQQKLVRPELAESVRTQRAQVLERLRSERFVAALPTEALREQYLVGRISLCKR